MSGIDGDFRAVLTSRLQDIESIVFSKYRHLPVANAKVKLGYSLFSFGKKCDFNKSPHSKINVDASNSGIQESFCFFPLFYN